MQTAEPRETVKDTQIADLEGVLEAYKDPSGRETLEGGDLIAEATLIGGVLGAFFGLIDGQDGVTTAFTGLAVGSALYLKANSIARKAQAMHGATIDYMLNGDFTLYKPPTD